MADAAARPSPLPPVEALSAAEWRARAETAEARVAELEATVAALQHEVTALRAQVAELLARLTQNSSNSSKPPSTEQPGHNRRPPREKGRRSKGAQKGHKGVTRALVPPEQVSAFVSHFPSACTRCGQPLDETSAPAGAPLRHQVVELPPIQPEVIEHQLHRVVCACGQVNCAELPPEARFGTGPRLTGLVAVLCGRFRISREETASLLDLVLGVPICKGTVQAACERASEAMAAAVSELEAAVSKAPAAHVDETGWREDGKRRWLWVAVAGAIAVFAIHRRRGRDQLRAWFAEGFAGVIISDRWSAYEMFPPEQRQLCWSHLRRDLQAIIDRAGAGKAEAEAALAGSNGMFHQWHRFRRDEIDRRALQAETQPFRDAFRAFCEAGKEQDQDRKWRALGTDLLKHWASVFLFLDREGIEPTNNTAERAIRPGVLWRKMSQGNKSEVGARFVARILTVATTCRRQGRCLLEFLNQAILAWLRGIQGPSLLPAPGG